jgi:hypothetical protein
MAISVSVSPGSGTVVTAVNRTGTISATVTAATDDPDNETINNVTSTTHTGITMTTGTTSCTLIGSYVDPFTDTFQYVEATSSDKLSTPVTVTGLANLPSDKRFYNLGQDTTASVTKSYTITVTYNTTSTSTFTVTHVINNTWDAIYSAVNTYYD